MTTTQTATQNSLATSADTTRRAVVILSLLAAGAIAFCLLRLLIGESIGWPTGEHAVDILEIRAMRMTLAVLTGAALALGGVALQALLRNPLAEPFILGLSSGAGVGVMVQMLLAYTLGMVMGPAHIGALIGAGASMAIVYAAGRRHGLIDPLGLLLVGVVLGTVNGALIMGTNYVVGSAGLRDDIARWMMGFLNEQISLPSVGAVAAVVAGSLFALLAAAPSMDAASFSDAEAHSVGVNLKRLRAALFLIASALAAGAVVLAGPLGFVGLIAPHAARLLLGPSHRNLLIASAMLGAMLVLAADAASVLLDLLFNWGRLPIGIFTSLIGGPVFIMMLRPHLGRGEM